MEKLRSVLIIEDDPTTAYLDEVLIEEFKVAQQVEIANDGEKALQLIRYYVEANNEEKIPQLILLDLNMPVMDGFEFLEAYQNLNFKNKGSVVVAVLTSSFNRSDVNRIKEIPVVNDFVVKPLTKEKMIGLLERHFGQNVSSK